MPTKQSVAIVIKNQQGQFLSVKRADDDGSLPGVWGLPGASLRENESAEAAAIRAGRDKLGVVVKVLGFVGEDKIDRGSYINHLREYDVEIIEGEPSVPQPDKSVSQYAAVQYTGDPTILIEAAQKGSLCSRIFLRKRAINWVCQSE